ncbi:ATP-dependent RNA helicase HrpA [Spectribacter hydrogenoxidans]|uniref:ATP-dependent RNA helicase HrpA n=1 Tax=Spectribacter hydrogenoxidans TaxID=3075608 RepID=A0ABU3BYB0_9GAMM|nr:ATP-dependent RNA helicase HrpA [Salinisphaera sp. W335]MDT0634301.1 ATP-dependent RNA helicase HrpA [Salinisphaera sp. W335]
MSAHNDRGSPLEELQTRDRHRLLSQLQSARSSDKRRALETEVAASAAKTRDRLAARPAIDLVAELPVSTRAEEIASAVRDHQVVVVCGATGSGKTTQLPKILMQAGLGARGLIGHTQPRRLAARSVAQRIADEVAVPLGGLVGFQTRFEQSVGEATQVKLMTDGILLAETARDRFLNRYEAIVIDEAHERTLNVDFLLGYLKRLLPKRPDLKLIVTSATIDPGRFSAFFNDAPVIDVEGRSYPVTVRYRPPDEGTDQPEAVEAAVRELWREGPGDILVFLPGERDIRDTERHLAKALAGSKFAGAEIVPLYARLTRSAQNRIFASSNGFRVVLATNVAETSLTVPGIRYVVDTGLARISRYSTAAKVQRLPIEPVARASCDQRAGRCGRVAPGICIRLFAEDDYDNRPAFTDPEIRRTNLASVLLTMADLRLGDIEDFPFVDPPERRHIQDGRNLLQQLEALTRGKDGHRITKLGRRLARLPLDPRIGRMLLAGHDQGVLPALRVLAAGLTIQDPRERPAEARQAADEAHKPFTDNRSDFIGLLRVWDAFAAIKRERSGNQLRKWCREHFLNFMRLREWEDLVRQLRRIGSDIGLPNQRLATKLADSDYNALHSALLAGLPDHVGQLDERGEYLGARGRRFRIFPGSALAGRNPKWLVAGELIETSRLYAHHVAMVEPAWIEQAAAHLVQCEHYEPHWAKRRGHVAGRERVKLFGLTLADGRKVDYGRIDRAAAREIFIRDGLVAFAVTDNRNRLPEFLAHNQTLVTDIADREARFRRRDLLVDETTQAAFYDEVLPAAVCDRKSLMAWINDHGDAALRFDEDSLLRHAGLDLPADAFPEVLRLGDVPIGLVYRFEPGDPDDGVTARLPLPMINQFPDERADWLVPGLLEEKIREYFKALPKAQRRQVVPVPEFARAAAERLDFASGSLRDRLREAVRAMTGSAIPADAWQGFSPSRHLQMRFEVIDEQGRVLDSGRDLHALRQRLGERAREAVQSRPDHGIERRELTEWPDTDLPGFVELDHGGVTLRAVPALVDRGEHVDLVLLDDPAGAEREHRRGVIRLLRLAARKPARFLKRELTGFKQQATQPLPPSPDTALADSGILASLDADPEGPLLADLLQAVIGARVDEAPRDAAGFEVLSETVRGAIISDAVALWDRLSPALTRYAQLRRRLSRGLSLDAMPCVEDMQDQLAHLIHLGFISHMPDPRHLDRYLAALEQRLDKLREAGSGADRERLRQISPYWIAYKQRAAHAARRGERPDNLIDLRWMIEEYRVQVFAQPLGTAVKVSPKRLDAVLENC